MPGKTFWLLTSFAATVTRAVRTLLLQKAGDFLILQNTFKTFFSEFYRFTLPFLFMVLFVSFKSVILQMQASPFPCFLVQAEQEHLTGKDVDPLCS